jgi:hypothetical protein
MEEIWKEIGIKKYAVSNLGNVRGQDGIRLLKPATNDHGYKYVTICNDGEKKKSVHILVMEAFVGERPDGYDIDHINRVRDDNRLENLRYCSRSENNLNTCRTRTDIEETDPILREKIIQKKYRDENKDKIIEYQNNYYEQNKDKRLEYQNNYYEQNKYKRLEYQRNYRQKKKEARL